MNKVKASFLAINLLLCLVILTIPVQNIVTATSLNHDDSITSSIEHALLPQDEEDTKKEETFEVGSDFPVLTGPSDTQFLWEVDFTRAGGDEDLVFDLTITGPEDWLYYTAEDRYNKEKRISAIRINRFSIKETIAVIAVAPYWLNPDPGDYTFTVETTSGDLSASIDLTARVTARYDLDSQTELTGNRLNISAKAGDESLLPISVTNTGTASLDTVNLSSSKPEGWSISFSPAKLENLAPGANQEIDVIIKPDKKTISGDYMVYLEVSGEPTANAMDLAIRVTVETSTKWGVIAILIIVAVAAALFLIFRQLGRR
jgi:uncharacterized membrane protein